MSNVYRIREDGNLAVRGKFRRLDAVLAVRDTALTAYLIKTLEDLGVEVTEDLMNKLYEAAETFPATSAGKYFFNEAAQRRPPTR